MVERLERCSNKLIIKESLKKLLKKFQGRKTEVSKEVNKTVQQIVEDIQKSGDTALFNYAKKFDGYDVNISNLLVTPMERETGLEQIDEDYFRILRTHQITNRRIS